MLNNNISNKKIKLNNMTNNNTRLNEIILITGNINKLYEFKHIIPNIINKKMDLPEIQSINVEDVIKEKVKYAYDKLQTPVICEDTGLYINDMNGFPGALIKFYYDSIGNDGICKYNNNSKATIKTVIGFYDGTLFKMFIGEIDGKIENEPKGTNGFGWDSIFEYNNKTLAEMSIDEKNIISSRSKAIYDMQNYFEKN